VKNYLVHKKKFTDTSMIHYYFISSVSDKDKDKNLSLKEQILDKMGSLITAAFGLVAALAWNEAIKAIFAELFGTTETIIPMISYAIIVTIIAVVVTILIARAISNAKKAIS